MIFHISEALAVVLWIGGILILVPLYRAHHDRALRYLAAVLVLFAVSRLFALTQERTSAVSLIVLNLLVLASAYCEVCFFRTALHREQEAPNPRFRAETAIAITIAAVAITTWALAPAHMRGNLAQPKYGTSTAAFLFVIVLIGYYISVSIRVIVWISEFSLSIYRDRRVEQLPSGSTVKLARTGLTMGTMIIGTAEVLRLAADVGKFWEAFEIYYSSDGVSQIQAFYPTLNLFIRIGHTGLYVGALLPILADIAQSVAIGRAQSRDFELLEPLWRALTPAFPGIEFRQVNSQHDRYYRRELEIRDCIMLLEPHYSRAVAEHARATAEGVEEREAYVAAALIRAALTARGEDQEAASDPHPIPTSGAATREEDMVWLVAIAKAFNQASANSTLRV